MSKNEQWKILSFFVVIIILLSLSFAAPYFLVKPHKEKPVDHFCKFSVDAGQDINVSTNETVIFLGTVNIPCEYWGGLRPVGWDFNGDNITDYEGDASLIHYIGYWGTGERYYFRTFIKYPEPGIYNATFKVTRMDGTYVAQDTRIVHVYETKLNFTISVDKTKPSTKETLYLHYSFANNGERGFNISGLAESNETVRLCLILEDGTVLKKYIPKWPTDGPPGPYWLGPGNEMKGDISFDLTKYYENETNKSYGFYPFEHPGNYQIYVEYVTMAKPVCWLSWTDSNIINITIA